MGTGGARRSVLRSSAFALALAPFLALPTFAESEVTAFDQGVAAYDRGDYGAAYDHWLPLAEEGDLAAQRNVAHLLRKGLGITKDPSRAFHYYKASADAGLASAQINLAALYAEGLGVPQSDKNAAHYYARAAKAGHANAQYHLALLAAEGRGMDKDMALSHSLLKAAAAQEHSLAKERLRELEARTKPLSLGAHPDPSGTPIKRQQFKTHAAITRALSDEARAQMLPSQQDQFDRALEEFASGERGEALEALRRLSVEGVAEARLRAGQAYLYGVGAPQNPASAFAFFQSAEAAGHPQAREMMKKSLMEMQRQALDQMDSD